MRTLEDTLGDCRQILSANAKKLWVNISEISGELSVKLIERMLEAAGPQ